MEEFELLSRQLLDFEDEVSITVGGLKSFFFKKKMLSDIYTGIASTAMTLFTNGVSLMLNLLNGCLTQLKLIF